MRLLIDEFTSNILSRNFVVLYTDSSLLFNDAVVDIPFHVHDLCDFVDDRIPKLMSVIEVNSTIASGSTACEFDWILAMALGKKVQSGFRVDSSPWW